MVGKHPMICWRRKSTSLGGTGLRTRPGGSLRGMRREQNALIRHASRSLYLFGSRRAIQASEASGAARDRPRRDSRV